MYVHQKEQYANYFLVTLVLLCIDLRPVGCYNICYRNTISAYNNTKHIYWY